MKIEKVHVKQIRKSETFMVQYHLGIEPIKKAYLNYLINKLKDSKKTPFSELTQKVSLDDVKAGDIVIKTTPIKQHKAHFMM
ncbi:MAG: hypothetical protein U9N53_01975 [Bacteroidota bacterium]|nr:hypothetical protein [Bacteroidota bacterium]